MSAENDRIEFTKEMAKDYTILVPNMAPTHFRLAEVLLQNEGYHLEVLCTDGREVVDAGLKYVHNDTCYPALLTIGQLMHALESGKYDLNKVAVMITQTGGGCRASNYIHLLRKALNRAGMSQVPTISLNVSGMEKSSGFSLSLRLLRQIVAILTMGDSLMVLSNQVRPYEVNKGDADKCVDKWVEKISASIRKKEDIANKKMLRNYLFDIAADFAKIPTEKKNLKKVGIVGEVYAKFSPLANNHLEEFLRSQNCEVMLPGLMAFMIFKVDNRLEDIKLYGGSKLKKAAVSFLMKYVTEIETLYISSIKAAEKFTVPAAYQEIKKLVDGVIGYGSKMGEGWFLTAEMIELVKSGYENVVCCQPFGCLPNHIVAKGMIRKIKQIHPNANIVPIDYDPGATRVNQENRIKLMLSVANQ